MIIDRLLFSVVCSNGAGYPFLMGLDTHHGKPWLYSAGLLLEALHTWIYITEVMLSPEGPRLYTPLSFSLDPTGLTPTTLFGLTADSRSDLDNGLAPFACPPRQTTWVHLQQLRLWIATIRDMPWSCPESMLLSLLAGGSLCVGKSKTHQIGTAASNLDQRKADIVF